MSTSTHCTHCTRPLILKTTLTQYQESDGHLFRTPILFHEDGTPGCGNAEIELATRIVSEVKDHNMTLVLRGWSRCGKLHEWSGAIKKVSCRGFILAGLYANEHTFSITYDTHSKRTEGFACVDALSIISGREDHHEGFFRVYVDPLEDCSDCHLGVLEDLCTSRCIISERDPKLQLFRYTLIPHQHTKFFPENTKVCPACMRAKLDRESRKRVFCRACELSMDGKIITRTLTIGNPDFEDED